MRNRVRNTTDEVKNEPLLGLIGAMNIPAQESMGQRQLINSCQLPAKWNKAKNDIAMLTDQYAKMGIKCIGQTHGDKIFMDVELPKGWEKKATDHSMWSELVDDKGRVRATIFYKATFYDREAFINFDRRYSFNVVTSLPFDQRGEYKIETVKVEVTPEDFGLKPDLAHDFGDGFMHYRDYDGTRRVMSRKKQYREEKQQIWVPRFKDDYEERNNTPHYYELTDGKTVFFTTKDDPIFYKKKHTEKNHAKWWKEVENIRERMRTQAINHLTERYPSWEDINAYWD